MHHVFELKLDSLYIIIHLNMIGYGVKRAVSADALQEMHVQSITTTGSLSDQGSISGWKYTLFTNKRN